MKNYLARLNWFIVIYAVWLILFAHFDAFTLISGLFFTAFALYYNEKFLLKKNIAKVYPLNIIALTKYFFFLLYEIYASGFDTIKMIIGGKVHPTLISCETKLNKSYLRAMLAHSITLTPGTVTLDLDENKIIVLWINPENSDSADCGETIKGNLENILLKGDK